MKAIACKILYSNTDYSETKCHITCKYRITMTIKQQVRIKHRLKKKVNGSPFSWGSSGRPLGPVTSCVLRKGKGILVQPMCLLWFTMPQRRLMGKGSRQSLERIMELTAPFLHSDREGAFTAVFPPIFQTIRLWFALHSGQPLSHRLWHQICKDLQGPSRPYFLQNDVSILEVITCI